MTPVRQFSNRAVEQDYYSDKAKCYQCGSRKIASRVNSIPYCEQCISRLFLKRRPRKGAVE